MAVICVDTINRLKTNYLNRAGFSGFYENPVNIFMMILHCLLIIFTHEKSAELLNLEK